ncbi:MAG: hypothetical protein ABIR54_24560 [Burkholderiaceae bacterium]|jgi:hypothetical protein
MSKTYVAAKPMSTSAVAVSLSLAFVVGLELTGACALSQGPGQAAAVAAADGSTLYVAPAVRMKVPKVEVSIVAQADTPAR